MSKLVYPAQVAEMALWVDTSRELGSRRDQVRQRTRRWRIQGYRGRRKTPWLWIAGPFCFTSPAASKSPAYMAGSICDKISSALGLPTQWSSKEGAVEVKVLITDEVLESIAKQVYRESTSKNRP